ncbi:MAG TPA: phospholipase D family protein, partial [Candidatus Methylomirabilis sp.]
MRRSLVVTALLLFVTLAACLTLSQALDLSLDKAPAEVYFSPHGGCTEAIVKEIGRAQSEILVQAYSFSS